MLSMDSVYYVVKKGIKNILLVKCYAGVLQGIWTARMLDGKFYWYQMQSFLHKWKGSLLFKQGTEIQQRLF